MCYQVTSINQLLTILFQLYHRWHRYSFFHKKIDRRNTGRSRALSKQKKRGIICKRIYMCTECGKDEDKAFETSEVRMWKNIDRGLTVKFAHISDSSTGTRRGATLSKINFRLKLAFALLISISAVFAILTNSFDRYCRRYTGFEISILFMFFQNQY